MKGIEKWKHVKLWMMCHLLLGYLKKHFHAWHKVRHLCKGTACYQTSNHLRRVKRWKQENHLVDFGGWPACKLGSHIARCAGGSSAILEGWRQKGFQLLTGNRKEKLLHTSSLICNVVHCRVYGHGHLVVKDIQLGRDVFQLSPDLRVARGWGKKSCTLQNMSSEHTL